MGSIRALFYMCLDFFYLLLGFALSVGIQSVRLIVPNQLTKTLIRPLVNQPTNHERALGMGIAAAGRLVMEDRDQKKKK